MRSPRNWLDFVTWGFFYYYGTTILVIVGVIFGHGNLKPGGRSNVPRGDVIDAFSNMDGKWYRQILEDGYSYESERHSNVAFFPAYPLAGRALAEITGLPSEIALLAIAHICLAGSFVVMTFYFHQRLGEDSESICPWALLAMGLLPTTLFFRMTYSESLFLLVATCALLAMERRWPLFVIAIFIGFATATRPVGVALVPPLAFHIWSYSPSLRGCFFRLAVYVPLACWGIFGFMFYQWLNFDEPFAFAKTQVHWRVCSAVSAQEHLISLITLEPIWSVLDPSSPCFWKRHEPDSDPLFSLHLANPVYFIIAILLIILGGCMRWLNGKELVLSLGLLLIPYLTRSHEMCMGSVGRFVATVFPVYLVLGHILGRIPTPAATTFLALCGLFLAIYAALFASGHRIF